MIEMTLHGPKINCQIDKEAIRHLFMVDPESGILVHVEVNEETAKQLAGLLLGSQIIVAHPSALKDVGAL